MKPKKSQAALEFLILSGVMMTIFVFFFAVATGKIAEMNEERRDKIASDIMDSVISELELAQQSLDGYTREFTLPENIEGREYEMALSNLQGENILSVKYMDKIYNRDVNVELAAASNRIYKGKNIVTKTNAGITVFNGNDPCINLIEQIGHDPKNSYCMGGMCYCFHGYYAPGEGYILEDPAKKICTKENDVDLAADECQYGCMPDDACNPAPAIVPFNPSNGKATVFVSKGQPPDTTAKITFDTNESATAVVWYLQSVGGVCPEEFPEKSYKQASADSLSKHFEILLIDMHADSEYCFEIKIWDSKKSERIYKTSNLDPNSLTTDPDQSPPLVRYARIFPAPTNSMYYLYGERLELFANITDDSEIDWDNTRAVIKQVIDDGSETPPLVALNQLEDQDSQCELSSAPTFYDVEHDDGHMQCFWIDNLFGKYASYSKDSSTLFYAGFDDGVNADYAAGNAAASAAVQPSAVPATVPGRYGNAMQMMTASQGVSYGTAGNMNIAQGTAEMWVKPEFSDALPHPLFYLGGSDGTNKLYLYKSGNSLSLLLKISQNEYVWSMQALNTKEWNFIAITWKNINSADAAEIGLYLNGEKIPLTAVYQSNVPLPDVGDFEMPPLSLGTLSANFYLGYDPSLTPSPDPKITMDQFRILSKAATQQEIAADYATERKYKVYFETKDILGETGSYAPEDYADAIFSGSFTARYVLGP